MNGQFENDVETTLTYLRAEQEWSAYRLIFLRLTAWRLEQELAAVKRMIDRKIEKAR